VLHFKALDRTRRREHNDRAWLAHQTAALYRTKDMPSLKSMMVPLKGAPKQQTWQEIKAALQVVLH